MLPLSSLNSHVKNDSTAHTEGQFDYKIDDNIRHNNINNGLKGTMIYLVLISFMAQFLLTPIVSAGTLRESATPREYIYTRYSPVTDDSWIGTPKKNTNNNNLGGTSGNATTSSKIAGGTQISDGSWILPKKNSNNSNLGGTAGNTTNGSVNNGNIILNSAPSNPKTENTTQITYIPVSTTIPAGYTTPNGTLITNLPSSYVAPVTVSSSIGLSSFSALGALTYNNITGVFGIAIANSTTTGALSMNDWIEFNNKENVLAFNNGLTRSGNNIGLTLGANGEILSMSGGVPTWMTPAAVSVPVTTVFGRTGSILGQSGDYTTTLVTEGTNLYYTDLRAQNALSGTLATITGSISTLSGTVNTLSGTISTLSGVVATKDNILSFNNGLSRVGNTIGLNTGINGEILSMSGGIPTWVAPGAATSPVSTVFGRLGAITSQTGDYNTSQITESGSLYYTQSRFDTAFGFKTTDNLTEGTTNLYFTNTRAQNALSGTLATITGSIATTNSNLATATGNIATLTTNLNTTNTNLATATGNISTLSGNLATTNTNVSTLSGNINTLTGTVNTLSGNLATTNTTAVTLSGRVNTTGANIVSLSGTVATLSGANVGILSNITTLSGTLATATANIASLSGSVATLFSNFTTLSGSVSTLSGSLAATNSTLTTTNSNLATATGNIATLTTNLGATNSNLATATGNINTLSGTVNTLSGVVAGNTTNINSISGSLATLSGVVALKDNILTFNNGLSRVGNTIGLANGANGEVLSMSGGVPTWMTPAAVSVPVTTVFGRTGSIIGQSGDYTTTLVTEGTNLYYTDLRAQNALSGTLATITGSISTLSGTVNTLSGNIVATNTNLATATGNIATLSGRVNTTEANIVSLSGTVNTLSGVVNTLSGTVATLSGSNAGILSNITTLSGTLATATANIASLSGSVATLFSNFTTLSGSVSTLSGSLATTNTNVSTLSGNINTLSGNINTLSGNLATTNTNLASLSGSLNTLSGVVALKDNILTFNNGLSRVGNTIGLANGANGEVLSMSGGVPTWMTPAAVSVPVTTVFGRTGSIIAQSGDYTTTLVTEGTNLYYTDLRAQNALSGTLATITGSISTLSGTVDTLSGNIVTTNTNLATATGNIATNTTNITTLSGNLNTLSGNVNTLSGVLATKISLTSLSVLGPLTYNNLTGVFGINIANSTTTGALSMGDWNIFNNKVGSINGLTGVTQTFAVGTAGTDFNISSVGTAHTFNLPDASGTARGLVSTGTQTFTGSKSFVNAPTFSSITAGSLLFAGVGGVVSQDNSNFFWDSTNKRLGIGTNAPVATLHNSGSTVFSALVVTNLLTGGAIGTAAATVDIKTTFNINQTTANQTLTIPSPTDTTAGRIIYINSIGTVGFSMLGERVEAGQSRQVIWNGTAWKWIGDQNGEMQEIATKSVSESIAVIGQQNDNELFFSVNAGETWVFSFDLNVLNNNSATPDWTASILGAAGWTCDVLMSGQDTAGGAFPQARSTNCTNAPTTMTNGAILASNTPFNVNIQGSITATTTGTVQLRWAPRVAANLTVLAGSRLVAYKIRGADLAEVYYTNDTTIVEGDIVSLAGNGVSQVSKSSQSYDSKTLGVISTKPGLVIGEADGTGKPVIVGLGGRVPVKVSTKNGDIQPGDYITTSDIPGVGMKATEPGRVIGKALTGLSGTEQGTIVVFIENTYFDGINENEYNSFLNTNQSGSISGVFNSPLDRFSFMVNKSLSKIDPSFSSGSMVGFGTAVNTLANNVNTLSGSVSTMFSQFTTISDDITTLKSQVNTINNTPQNTPITEISGEDRSILDAIIGTINSLIIQVGVTFSEMATFMKSVIFQSTVTFRDRVTYEDKDMGGTAIIQAGSRSVHISYNKPYSTIPKVTVTGDTFVNYRVTGKGINGFTIETQVPVTENTSFDWIVMMIVGTNNSISNTPAGIETESSISTNAILDTVIDSTNTIVTVSTGSIENNTGSIEIIPVLIENTTQSESGSTIIIDNTGITTPIVEIIDSTGVLIPEATTIAPTLENTATGDINSIITPIEITATTPVVGDELSITTGTGS